MKLYRPPRLALLKFWFAPLVFALALSATAEAQSPCAEYLRQDIASAENAPEQAIPWFEKISFVETENVLAHGRIVDAKDLLQYLSSSGKKASGTTENMQLVVFEDGTRGVWKPGDGRIIEIAAYQAARLLGLNIVPPTIERERDGVRGSIQFFVDTPLDLVNMSGEKREKMWQKVPIDQRADFDIFSFVFGEWDLHWGNRLIDGSYSVVKIDNNAMWARQQVRYGEKPYLLKLKLRKELQTVSSASPFPFTSAKFFDHPTREEVEAYLKQYANAARVDSFMRWRPVNSDLSMRVAIWENAIWIQAVGYQKYGPIRPASFPPRTLEALKKLNFENLRAIFGPEHFAENYVREILDRRDQILHAARQTRPLSP